MRIKVFGCKTNKYFAERWLSDERLIGKNGTLVASCVVTDKAKAKWIKFVRQTLAQTDEHETIFITGCGTLKRGQVRDDFFAEYPELLEFSYRLELLAEDPSDAREHAPQEVPLSASAHTTNLRERLLAYQETHGSPFERFIRKYLVVQTGCDNHCTFCLTVMARGQHRSRPVEEILAEIHAFTAAGGKEVILTGTNLGAWGADNSNQFSQSCMLELIEAILVKTSVTSLRLSSLGVEFLTPEVLTLFREPRIAPYLHASVQSGSDFILQKMGRHYSAEAIDRAFSVAQNIRREDGLRINIGADLIVGFPGETDEAFNDTLTLTQKYVTQLHAFAFSAHERWDTVPASFFPNQIDASIKSARLQTLLAAGHAGRERFRAAHNGMILTGLVEKFSPKTQTFRAETVNYIPLTPQNFTLERKSWLERGAYVRGTYRYMPETAPKDWWDASLPNLPEDDEVV